ncbi:MAG: hypothetical protein ABSC19_02420 [Syntrophorhabdales bacterium]|jgi:hypothetical protein
MNRISVVRSLFLVLALTLLAGCGGGSSTSTSTTAPLSADTLNLIFVVSPDLAYNAPGDISPSTGNLTDQGLQRSLLMATYLKQQVLGTKNVTRIYALEPMSHLQTTSNYPDMAAIGFIQQFALLNQITLTGEGGPGSPLVTGNSYPLDASYASGPLPGGVATPLVSCPGCQGLDFNDTGGNNVALVTGIINANVPGFYVFSAPWETISALLANINNAWGYDLNLPATYMGPNYVYAISIAPSGYAGMVTYNSNLNPPSTYPVLPGPVASASCTAQTPFNITRTAGSDGNETPKNINTNETVYMIRHAEAHPTGGWDDGNYVGAGQWRALALPNALRDKISPDQVYSIDPAQVYPGAVAVPGNFNFSYVRPSLTVEPYAIANNLPYYLVSDFEIFAGNSPQLTSDFFFTGGRFSNQTVLLAWEHDHFPLIVNALLSSYKGSGQTAPPWPSDDYDTIWTVTLDAQGNVKVNNEMCEGIDSAKLPATAPQF